MANISPEVLDYLEQVRQVTLSYPDAEEYFPWGNRAYFRAMKGRNFLFLAEKPDNLEVALRLPYEQRKLALERPYVQPHRWLEQQGWVSARIEDQTQLDSVIPWVGLSYEMNKPVRQAQEALEGEKIQGLIFLDRTRQVALGFGEIEEYFPYGDRAFRSHKGQIFLYASENDDRLKLSVRLPLGEREYALSLPYVEVPKYTGHKGWVSATVSSQDELEVVLPWIAVSFELNRPRRKIRTGS